MSLMIASTKKVETPSLEQQINTGSQEASSPPEKPSRRAAEQRNKGSGSSTNLAGTNTMAQPADRER